MSNSQTFMPSTETLFQKTSENTMVVNLGPQHPSTHGVLRVICELEGETIISCKCVIGYLHTGMEKEAEYQQYQKCVVMTDRMDYLNANGNNLAHALAVEKLCGLSVPDRCQWYRMALGELARISDHLTCTGAMAMELGAFTPFLWFVKAREMVWDILEEETGARLTHSFGRIGGMAKPPTADFKGLCAAALPKILELVQEGEKMLLKNRIFIDRLQNVGPISGADAIALGFADHYVPRDKLDALRQAIAADGVESAIAAHAVALISQS